MAPKKKKSTMPPIGEHVRITVDAKLEQFLSSPEKSELEFPNHLSPVERAYIHMLVRKHGLRSKSRGTGDERYITIYKRNLSTIIQADSSFYLTPQSFQIIHNLLATYPITPREQSDVELKTNGGANNGKSLNNTEFIINPGRLNEGIALVPNYTSNPALIKFRDSLPIAKYKNEIVNLLNTHQVVLVSGETGSGKTTQIPQYILDEASLKKQCCRIICTQPRRISAISVAERVAYERAVEVGQDVGYQIRLESRVSPETSLIYCTTGVLLRTLMGSSKRFSNITHVIVDEVHERDKFTDYLLIVLKDCLENNSTLKVILMSATMDTKVFTDYFNNCPHISVPGRLYSVKTYFLEEIFKLTNYTTKDMKKILASQKKKKKNRKSENLAINFESLNMAENIENGAIKIEDDSNNDNADDIDNDLKDLMDRSLQEFWHDGSSHHYGQILHLILNENVSVNYQHRDIGCTILMLCAGRGFTDHTEHILSLGANVKIKSHNDWTAYDWALNCGHKNCADLIVAFADSKVEALSSKMNHLQNNVMSDEMREVLEAYSNSFDCDEKIDHELILHIIKFIHSNQDDGGILVFLPGFDDIIELRDLVISDERLQDKPYQLFILHSNMQTRDHKLVFQKLVGVRKIILSTNIAQTSITIDDVVYVIDSGKVKEISFDGISNTTCLRSNWISRACATQRAGRAGRVRPGMCFALFSSVRYNEAMKPFAVPDILRTPLQELCLQTKMLAPGDMPIAEFLQKAIDSPPSLVTTQAVELLKIMGALDGSEGLTELGIHLVNMPIEPKLSKMIMYGVVLKCLDPVLTIACCLAHKEPFIIPIQTSEKKSLAEIRKEYSAKSFSDHMMLLQVFQAWQKSRQGKYERQFCRTNFINSATMEQILNTRAQLLGHLRATGFVQARKYYDIKFLNTNSDNWAVVKAAIVASSYPSVCRLDKEFMTLRTEKENKVAFHPSSCLKTEISCLHKPSIAQIEFLKKVPSEWMIYEEKSRVGPWCFIRVVTFVTPVAVALFGGSIRNTKPMVDPTPMVELTSDSDSENEACSKPINNSNRKTFAVDDWNRFDLDGQTADNIYDLRRKWNALFIRRMNNPSKLMNSSDEAVLSTIVKVLTNEDLKAEFVQPAGIGQRPLSTEDNTPGVYSNFTNKKNYTPKKLENWRDVSTAGNTSSGRKYNCWSSNFFLFRMNEESAFRHKQLINVNQRFSMIFHRILQGGGKAYIIFLSTNSVNFDGIAEVKGGSDQKIYLNWLSRLLIPIKNSGFGSSIDISFANDGIELEQDLGKSIMNFLVNYKPSYQQSFEQYYGKKK